MSNFELGAMLFALITILGYMGLTTWIIRGQRADIDRLTDKLMAKDYSEYKRHREPFQDTKDTPKPRKPMSYFDDPNVEIEDESVN
jgi:hypothetical protein